MAGAEDITSLARLCEYAARAMARLVGPAQGLVWVVAGEAAGQELHFGQWGLPDNPAAKECPLLILQDLESEGMRHRTAVERSTLGLAPGLATAALESVSLPLSPTFGCWMGVLHEQPSLSREQSLSLSILGRHIGVLLHRLHIDIDRIGTESKYRTLIEHIPAATYYRELDRPGQASFMSPQIEDILGYPPQEFVEGGPAFVRSIVHEEDRGAFIQAQEDLIQHATTISGSFRMLHRDGRVVWVLNHVLVIPSESGGSPFVIGLIFDVTEFKELEIQFRHSQKMEAIGRLAGGIAHDFNNLLAVILGYSWLAADVIPDDSPFRDDIQEIIAAGERAKGLVSQLLSFSRRDVIQAALLDPAEVLDGMKSMYERIVHSTISFSIAVPPALGLVYVDRGQLEQVLMNLLINACDAMPGGGVLTLEAENVVLDDLFQESLSGIEPGEYVSFSVRDTGHGMTKEIQQKIFDPFFTTKPVGKGTGLGLSTVHGIVRQNNGAIWVYSELGLGTTIKVYLPRHYDGQEARVPACGSHQVPHGNQERLLVVEDDPQLRSMLVKALSRLGYQVFETHNGRVAQQMIEQGERFDLVLSDVVMPVLGGIELMRWIQEHEPGLHVLLMSGYAGDESSVHGAGSLIDISLKKPFTLDELARTVHGTLGGS